MLEWSGSTNHHHMQGAMSSPNGPPNHNNVSPIDPNRDPTPVQADIEPVNNALPIGPNFDKVSVKDGIEAVDNLELADVRRRKQQEGLTEDEIRREEAIEAKNRARGSRRLSTLPHSYRLIRNLLWIKQHPVYGTALVEWESEENLFASRIGRKLKRSGGLKNDIYQMIGFYSVFQGVLFTATAQSSYLHCLNVGLPIALSVFASVGTLVHISRKFTEISNLRTTITTEERSLKEVKARILALKEKGEAFRFNDFREDKETTWSNFDPKFYICGLKAEYIVVFLAIFLFSVVFIIAHPLILCRSGKGQTGQ